MHQIALIIEVIGLVLIFISELHVAREGRREKLDLALDALGGLGLITKATIDGTARNAARMQNYEQFGECLRPGYDPFDFPDPWEPIEPPAPVEESEVERCYEQWLGADAELALFWNGVLTYFLETLQGFLFAALAGAAGFVVAKFLFGRRRSS